MAIILMVNKQQQGEKKKGPPFSVLVRNEKRRKGERTRDTNILGDE